LDEIQQSPRPPHLLLVQTSAAELGFVPLQDALAIVELIEAADGARFDAAAVRWAARLATEVPGLSLAQLRLAVDALDALPTPEAMAMLSQLADRARPVPAQASAATTRLRRRRAR
jgi:hypothetical protein